MIGVLTEKSVTAMAFALTWEQLVWPQDDERFAELQAESERLLDELGLTDIDVPETRDGLTEARAQIGSLVTQHLSAERGRLLGDTVALPLFFLESFALRAAINLGLHVPDTGELELIGDCLEDLGLDRGLVAELEREAGWITLFEGDTEADANIRTADVIRAASSFTLRALEEFRRREGGLDAVLEGLDALTLEVREFREEHRVAAERFEALVLAQQAELTELLAEVQAALVAGGADPAEAAALTEGDPKGFLERTLRWLVGADARNATEAAFWAALDFVPGGTGVKLGFKVAQAVRGALKKEAERP